VLLAIRPRFAESIFNGEKKVEFRKIRFRQRISHMVLYATKPIQKIVGYFYVRHVAENTPEYLWTRYGSVGGLSYKEFRDYYATSRRGVAIEIGSSWRFREPVPVSKLDNSLITPQSFAYLPVEVFEAMTSRYV
jgi:predicted transcriptional regulator